MLCYNNQNLLVITMIDVYKRQHYTHLHARSKLSDLDCRVGSYVSARNTKDVGIPSMRAIPQVWHVRSNIYIFFRAALNFHRFGKLFAYLFSNYADLGPVLRNLQTSSVT